MIYFFKQKTAYEMRISDWSSDVCSSDLKHLFLSPPRLPFRHTGMCERGIMPGSVHAVETQLAHVAAVPAVFGQRLEHRAANHRAGVDVRSEERRVGKECVRTCSYRWSQNH